MKPGNRLKCTVPIPVDEGVKPFLDWKGFLFLTVQII
jgi:hypothetical protein